MLFADDQPAGGENFRIIKKKATPSCGLSASQGYYTSSGPPLHPSSTTPNAELSDFMTDKRTAGEGGRGGAAARE